MTELDKLEQYLKDAGIRYERIDEPFGFTVDADFPQRFRQIIVYDDNGKRLWDAVCHPGSYGYKDGLLEVMGKPLVGNSKDVIGYLTAQVIIDRLTGHKGA